MSAENLALKTKQKFMSELENNIPETGDFEKKACSEVVLSGYEVCFKLFSVSSEKRSVTVTAKKDGRSYTSYLFQGTNAEILEWLRSIDEKELLQKAGEAVYSCGSFYYP